MNVGTKGLDLIKQFEGCRLAAYQDVAGTWTIGWGTTQINGRPVTPGLTITQQQADAYLIADANQFARGISGLLSATLTQNQFDALVCFTYNLGVGAFQGSTLRKTINTQGPQAVTTDLFTRFNKAVDPVTKQKVPIAGLTRRREAEATLFGTAPDTTVVPGGVTPKQESAESLRAGVSSHAPSTQNVGAVIRYPMNLTSSNNATTTGVSDGAPPWVLFEVKAGRHILRTGLSEAAEKDTTIASCALYLPPDALTSSQEISWDSADLGAGYGSAIESMFQKGGGLKLPSSLTTGTFDVSIKNAKEFATAGLKGLGGATLQSLANISEDATNVAGAATGRVLNPRTDLLFKSTKYREHTMTFKLVPRNKEEADQIDRILNVFQYYSLPSYGDTWSTSYFIGYPYEFTVTMFSQRSSSRQHHLNTIDRSVLTSVKVNHAPSDNIAFASQRMGDDNFYPVMTELTLSFTEVRLPGRDERPANVGRGSAFLRGGIQPGQTYPSYWNDQGGPLMVDPRAGESPASTIGVLGAVATIEASKEFGKGVIEGLANSVRTPKV